MPSHRTTVMAELDIDWFQAESEIQVTVLGRFQAADNRQMQVDYDIDRERQTVTLRCRVSLDGRRYRHDSVLRGFCAIPLSAFKKMDPDACDWQAEIIS